MFQFWLFADHGIYASASHTNRTMQVIHEGIPWIEGEYLIYVA